MGEKLIDISEIFSLFKKKFWIIIMVTIITTGLTVYKASKMVSRYQGSMTIFIGKSDNILDYYEEKEILYYSEFMNIFNEVIRTNGFLDDSLQKNSINKSSDEVSSGISITASEKSPIFKISYTSFKNEKIEDILNMISNEFSSYIQSIVPETKPKVIDEARVATITPNKSKLIIVGFGIGLILSIGLIFVLDYLDDTVKSKDRLEKILPIPAIGEIPKHEKIFREE
ncbi:MAG: Wzz/FepE/Etk N-terminal domain-containing protein [Romboutsia sp.]